MDGQRHLTDRQKKWIAGSGLALFFLLSALVCWFAGQPLISRDLWPLSSSPVWSFYR